MQNLSNISVIRDLLTRYGFTFSKALGQNFLINPSVCPRMAELGGAAPGTGMIEIGAGIGVLTAELAKRADKVVCVEIDSRLLPILDETLGEFDNIRIVNDDVLKVDLHRLIEEEFAGMEVAVCANLPYYITSPILMHLLEEKLPIRSITVMVQKEAAARLTAEPGTREVGAISIALRYYLHPVGIVPGEPGQLHARPRCGLHSDPAGSAARTGSEGPGRGPLLPDSEGSLFPAPQDSAQLRERLLPPAQRGSDCPAGDGGNPSHRPGGTALDGAVRRPVRSPA